MQKGVIFAAQTAGDIMVSRACTLFISAMALGSILSGTLLGVICGVWLLGMMVM